MWKTSTRTIGASRSAAPSSSSRGACRSRTAWLPHFSHTSALANRRGHRRNPIPHCSGLPGQPADTRTRGAGILLVRVLRRAGLKPVTGRRGPRIHDLRHAFVANRMLAWYREGVNPQSRLPYLATYLGHKDINSTLVCLTITQELLQQASERFRVRGAQILRASIEGGNA